MAVSTRLLFTFRLVPVVNAMLSRRGIDTGALLREAGLPQEALHGEITAPLQRVQEFVDRVAAALDMSTFGLELADTVPAGSYGIAEFLMRSAATVEASLRALCEFGALVNPMSNFRFVHGADGEGCFHYAIASQRDTLGMHLNEFTLGYIVRQFAANLGGHMPLSRVWFSHARARDAEVVAQKFGCPLLFQAADCGFAVHRDILGLPVCMADPLLHGFLSQQARRQLAHAGQIDIVTHVVRMLEPRLAQSLSAEDVARAMGMTPRSLQRHLADAGTTYRDVLQHVRMRRRAELAGGGLDESAIATMLGFSDVRAMRRSLDE